MYGPADAQFVVYLSFYPPCTRTYIADVDLVDWPVRLFHGTADDIAPLTQCLSHVKRLQAARQDVQLIEYVGAYHGFDNPLTPVRPGPPQSPRRGCDLYEQPAGHILNRETGLPFTRSRGSGPTRVTGPADHSGHSTYIRMASDSRLRLLRLSPLARGKMTLR